MATARPEYDEKESLRPFIHKVNKAYSECHRNGALLDLDPDIKSNRVAHTYNADGEDMLLTKRYLRAIECFSRAIANAEEDSVEMAAGYTGRAEALLCAGYYRECLSDIERALENPCSKEMIKKIQKKKYRAEKMQMKQDPPFEEVLPVIPADDRNKVIKCASRAIELKQDPVYGRQIIATRDIQMGEVIVVERPFVTMVLPKQEMFYCAECAAPCLTLIPCPTCTQIMFCGKNCRKMALKKYHRYECKILKTMKSQLTAHVRVALKITLRHKKVLEDVNAYRTESNIYCSDRFWEILNLNTHVYKRDDDSMMAYAFESAAVFELMLKHSDFFEEFPNSESREIFKGLLMKLSLIESTHFHHLYNIFAEDPEEEEVKTVIGGYSFLSLLNHSCEPNVFRVNIGKTMVLMTNSDIKKGEQLFDNYGLHYSKDSREERQSELQVKYFFNCKCEACANNWPTLENLPRLDSEARRKLAKISEQIYKNRGDTVAIRSALEQALKFPTDNLPKPSWEYFLIRDIIEQGYTQLMQKTIVIK